MTVAKHRPARRRPTRKTSTIADVLAEIRVVRGTLGFILSALDSLKTGDTRMAKKLAEYVAGLQAEFDEQVAKLTRQTTVIGAIKTLVQGQGAQIAALKQQLQDALDAGGDPAVLQPLIDAFDANEKLIDANTDLIAEAVVTGTEAGA